MSNDKASINIAVITFFKVIFSRKNTAPKIKTKIGVILAKVIVTPALPWERAK